MTEEQRAKRKEYMKRYYENMSYYQKEKKRLRNLELKRKKYHDKTPEKKAKRKEENRRSYLKNIDRIKAYAKAYRLKKKEKC